jgi:zinc transport system substrate-binding protein
MFFKPSSYIGILFLFLSAATFAQAPIQVFVSIAPQQYLVESIGQNLVDVSVMLLPGESPETFDPTLKQIAGLKKTQLYFRIGVEFENKWLDNIKRSRNNIKIVDCCKDIIESRSVAFDSHIWTSARNAQLLAAVIKQELIIIDPVHTEEYENNYLNLVRDLEQLDNEIYALLNKRRTDYFIISHAALGHFAADYGLIQLSLENQGKELGARSLIGIIERAREEKIQTLFIQKQHKSAAAMAFANEIDARVIEVDVQHGDYINNLRDITNMMAEAMR